MFKICITFKCFDCVVLDKSVKKVAAATRQYLSIKCVGPIPLPSKVRYYTVTRSPHVDKKSREQFSLRCHKRYLVLQGLENIDYLSNDSNSSNFAHLLGSDVLSDSVEVKVKVFND